MTVGTSDYALLAQDAYRAPQLDKNIKLGDALYRTIDYVDDPRTGFQATAYERLDTHEVVIAFRGTEFDREPVKDGGVDAGMVLVGVNAQTPDALAFTQQVLDKAKQLEEINKQPIAVTVTGHSLGGTLAEISASRFGLKGETFNAYGAAGLLQDVPEGGHQVIDHVRAGDLVSAASPHFGEVRIYAAPQDIETLTKAGYRDDSHLLSPRNPIQAIDFKAHAIDNFVPDSKLLGHSIIGPQGEALYRDHQGMIDRYRNDVRDIRMGLSAGWEIPHAVAHGAETLGETVSHKAVEGWHAVEHVASHVAQEASQAYDATSDAVKQEVMHGVYAEENAGRAIERTAEQVDDPVRQDVGHSIEATSNALSSARHTVADKASQVFDTIGHPGSWLHGTSAAPSPRLDQASHLDHVLFQQARTAVHHLDATHQRTPDQRSDNLAAALTVAARQSGLRDIHHAVLSDDASRAYAVQGDLASPFKRIAQVPTSEAMATSIEQSSATWERESAKKQAEMALAPSMPSPAQQHDGPTLGH